MKIKGMVSADGTDRLVPVEMEITDPDIIEKISGGMLTGLSLSESNEEIRDDSDGGIERALSSLLNSYCAENVSGTPDFILAKLMIECLKSYNEAVSHRAQWRGEEVDFQPGKKESDAAEIDRNARGYGFEIGRGRSLTSTVEGLSDDNPFLDPKWREKIQETKEKEN